MTNNAAVHDDIMLLSCPSTFEVVKKANDPPGHGADEEERKPMDAATDAHWLEDFQADVEDYLHLMSGDASADDVSWLSDGDLIYRLGSSRPG